MRVQGNSGSINMNGQDFWDVSRSDIVAELDEDEDPDADLDI
jgi:hypothetical protein